METKNKIVRYLLIILAFFLIAFFSTSSLWAATYYVTQTGAGGDTGANCANAKSLAWFNANATAGDDAILCDDTYTTPITPAVTGTSVNRITYTADNQYLAVITTGSYGSNLTDKDYVTIDGLYFNGTGSRWILMSDSDYCIIQNCKFYDASAFGGINLADGSTYNEFLDNVFPDAPLSYDANGTKPSDLINTDYSGSSSYNVVEGNTFGSARHTCIGIYDGSTYWVIRNNTFQNKYHTAMGFATNMLVENNRIYDSGINHDDLGEWGDGVTQPYRQVGMQINWPGGIIRNNILDNNGSALYMSAYATDYQADNIRIYNNTLNKSIRLVHGSYGAPFTIDNNKFKNNALTDVYAVSGQSGDEGTAYLINYRTGYRDYGYGVDNEWLNNNFYDSSVDYIRYEDTRDTLANIQTAFTTAFPDATNISVDPKYTDAANRDFTLQSDSSMIDAGAWLTTITSPSINNATSFTVADSRYFYDGWGIPGELGDIIKTQNGEVTTIMGIDYNAHTITVSPDIDIVKNEGLALDYTGLAPDIGAYEYGISYRTIPASFSNPPGLTIKSVVP